jgi:hypothetical protein
MSPPEFAEYSQFLQYGAPPEGRDDTQGLQALLRSSLGFTLPERAITLDLAWYDVGEPLVVESQAAFLRETWAGPPPPPPANTWGLGQNLFVTLYVVSWHSEGGKSEISEISQVELGFAHLPLVTSTGTFLLGPHELRLPARTVIAHIDAELHRVAADFRARVQAAQAADMAELELMLQDLLGPPPRFESLVGG